MPDPSIISRQNERVKNAVKLRSRREREKQARFTIDGLREISRAIAAGVSIAEAFVCEPLCKGEESRRIWRRMEESGANVATVSEEVFAKLAFGERAEGIVAIAPFVPRSLADLRLDAAMLVCVVEGIEKPGNLGAILRSADAAGVTAVVVTGSGTDIWNPNTIRASLGTVFTVPVYEATSNAALCWLREGQFRIFAARVDAGILYSEANFTGRSAIVLGSEADGLSNIWQDEAVQAIRLPMLGAADSLNVSATASVLFYEALRQRG